MLCWTAAESWIFLEELTPGVTLWSWAVYRSRNKFSLLNLCCPCWLLTGGEMYVMNVQKERAKMKIDWREITKKQSFLWVLISVSGWTEHTNTRTLTQLTTKIKHRYSGFLPWLKANNPTVKLKRKFALLSVLTNHQSLYNHGEG